MPPAIPKSRKHVTKACTQCRESKTKCDGVSPMCSSCSRKGKDCRYEVREDRRKLSLRIAVDLLAARVRQLSQFITDKGLAPPPMKPDDSTTLSGILQCLGLEMETALVSSQSPTEKPNGNSSSEAFSSARLRGHDATAPALSQQDVPILDAVGAADGSLAFFGPDHAAASAASVFDSLDTEAETLNESDDELVNQLSDRVGTLHIKPGGHIRYLGSTSNFNLLEMPGVDGATNVYSRTVRDDGMDYLCRLGIGNDVPLDIEEHLVSLYFAWQDPATHVVDRAIYDDAKQKWHAGLDTPYYSETLRNAICAVGAAFDTRYHPVFVTFPRSLADFFADRAKVLLELELDASPTIATVQSLVVLSAHDVGSCRDTRGWLYSGMAMRLAFVLGLHQDLSQYVTKDLLGQDEADLRQVVFWSTCIVDHVWSFYLGQPFRFALENATVEKPPLHPTARPLDCTGLVCRYQALLFEAMSPLSTTVYGSLSIPKTTLQEINTKTVADILHWRDTLPAALQVDAANHVAPYLPHVLLMHMQFHQAIIYAHRPYMSKSYLQPSPPQGPGAGHARQMCIDAASAVAQLLGQYEARYALRRMNVQGVAIAFSAALILTFVTIAHQPAGRHDVLGHLGTCFRALDALGSTWESARRARTFIVRIQRHWESQSKRARRRRRSSFRAQPPGYGTALGSTRNTLDDSHARGGLTAPLASGSGSGSGDGGVGGPRPGPAGEVLDGLNLGMDLDLDWMLTADLQGRPEDWGSLFAVPSGDDIFPPRYEQ